MSEFSVQSEGIDVERIMEQVRARIRANRDDDASDAQVREQADAKAAELLNPGGARSALAARPTHAKGAPAPSPAESFDFDHDTIYRSSRGAVGGLLYGIRKLLGPLLKFLFNVRPVVHALAVQSRINAQQAAFDDRVARLFDMGSSRLAAREEIDKLNHRVMNDLVAETTRLSVEMKNHRMLVESVAARLDFLERQARAKESGAESRTPRQAADQPTAADGRTDSAEPARRRRRRGRRRSGRAATATEAAADAASGETAAGGDDAVTDSTAPAKATAMDSTAPAEATAMDSTAPAEPPATDSTTPPEAAATARVDDGVAQPAEAGSETTTASEDAQPAPAQPSGAPDPEVKPPNQ